MKRERHVCLSLGWFKKNSFQFIPFLLKVIWKNIQADKISAQNVDI